MIKIITTILILVIPAISHSICLENCDEARPPISFDSLSFNGAQTSNMNYGSPNYNTGDVKNSVLGDMNIRVGHEKVDINMDANSSGNTVDTSINSTIILGDMEK